MIPLKSLIFYCAFLAMLVFHFRVAAEANEENADEGIDCLPDNNRTDDGDLCQDFQIIRDLIGEEELTNLVQSHYQCNAKFRKAMNYYNSSRFDLVVEQLQQSEAYNTLLEELRKAGVDTTDIDNIADIFGCILIPLTPTKKKCNCKELRGHTFIGDVLAALPHQAVREYTNKTHMQKSNFALFRQTVIAPEFQAKLRANLLKRDAIRPLRVLRRNGWDMPELLRGAMSILSW